MKKILISVMAVALCLGLMGGAFALFSDTETSTGNTMTAGTLDLTLDDSVKVAFPLPAKPGDTSSGTITVKNEGNLPGHLYATSWYVTADGTEPVEFDQNMSDDEVASQLLITEVIVGGQVQDLNPTTGWIPDVDADGRITVYDMVNDPSGGSVTGYADPALGEHGWYDYFDMAPEASCAFVIALQFDPLAGNEYQADGITWTIEFLLTQK